MTESDTDWAPIPDAGYYEASARGEIRSVDRTIGARFYPGKTLTPKRSGTSPYWEVKLTFDDGKARTVPVHVLVLRAHRGMPGPDQVACHADDDNDNNDLSNLSWEDDPTNREDRWRNSPPAAKAPKVCIICEREFDGMGRRCHPCIEQIGVTAAAELSRDVPLKTVTEHVGYPLTVDGLSGVHRLARLHGGYGQSRSQRVRKRLAARLAGGDAR